MIIITDNPSYAKETLRFPDPFTPLTNPITDKHLKFLTDLLFPSVRLYFSKADEKPCFSTLVVRRYAEVSQFDQLMTAGSDDPELRKGVVCFAGSGDKFHGFHQRRWESMPGNIHMSISLFPSQKIEKPAAAFLMLAANTVVQTINGLAPLAGQAGVHWINDIVIEGRKVGGVLCQTQMLRERSDRVVLGIGLNVIANPKIDFDPCVRGTTAINHHVKNRPPYHISEIFWPLLNNLEGNYRLLLDDRYEELLNYYLANSVLVGKKVAVFSDLRDGKNIKIGEGRVLSVSENLELLVEGMNEPLRKGRVRLID